MPLIKCPDCKTEVSDQAQNCPKCGYPFAKVSADEALNAELRQAYASKQLIGAAMLYVERHPGTDIGRAKMEVEKRLGLAHTPPAKQSPGLMLIGFILVILFIVFFLMGKL